MPMPNLFWRMRNILAKKSEIPEQYNLIQRFFGSQQMWKQFVKEYRLDQEQRILDIGCGTAEILSYLPRNISYIGVDNHQPYIDSCKKNAPQQQFICSDWSELKKKQHAQFDIVLFLGVLHHLDDISAQEALSIGYSILKPNGRILSLDGTKEDDCSRWESVFYRVDRGGFIRSAREYQALFPQPPKAKIHANWLRVPYRYLVCELQKRVE